jgi:hypothetical protein
MKMEKSRMKISVCVVVVKCWADPILWLGSVLWDAVNTDGIVEGKPAEMRQSVRWDGRRMENVEAGVVDMECGVLSIARR